MTRAARLLFPLLFLSVSAPHLAVSQVTDSSPSVIRARLRTTQDPASWRRGTLIRNDADSVVIALEGGGTITLPRKSVAQVQTSNGRRSRVGAGAGLGFGIGVVLGLGAGAAASNSCYGCDRGGGATFVGAGLMMGLLGAGIGALIGSAGSSEQWVTAENNTAPRVAELPAPRRWHVGLQVPF